MRWQKCIKKSVQLLSHVSKLRLSEKNFNKPVAKNRTTTVCQQICAWTSSTRPSKNLSAKKPQVQTT